MARTRENTRSISARGFGERSESGIRRNGEGERSQGQGRRIRGSSVRKHCKVICRGVSRENREVLTFLVPTCSLDVISTRQRRGEERNRHDAPTITARRRHPWLSDGRMNGWADMPRSDGLPKGWLYYARRFSARPGVKRSKIALAVTTLKRVGCGMKEAC